MNFLRNLLALLIVAFAFSLSHGQSELILDQPIVEKDDSIQFIQIKTDSLYNSKQIISLLIVQKNFAKKRGIDFAYSQSELRTTSSFAKEKNALAAVNGGFFNMESGGSATYFEVGDTVISRKRNPELKYGIEDSITNGAILIMDDFEMKIQKAKAELYYESSKQESAVLVTGPLLLLNSEIVALPNMKFTNHRHPRTCLCINENYLVLITIDGRNPKAEGMSLIEAQHFLRIIGCDDAINLDGGGSTSMWIQNKGIVNFPSDKNGERPVANAILILDKN